MHFFKWEGFGSHSSVRVVFSSLWRAYFSKGGGTDLAGPVLAGPLFYQIIIILFILFVIIFIKCIFGVRVLIVFKVNVASILAIRNNLQMKSEYC